MSLSPSHEVLRAARCAILHSISPKEGNVQVIRQGGAMGNMVAFGIGYHDQREWFARAPIADEKARPSSKHTAPIGRGEINSFGAAWEEFIPCSDAMASHFSSLVSDEKPLGREMQAHLRRLATSAQAAAKKAAHR